MMKVPYNCKHQCQFPGFDGYHCVQSKYLENKVKFTQELCAIFAT